MIKLVIDVLVIVLVIAIMIKLLIKLKTNKTGFPASRKLKKNGNSYER